MKARVDEGPGSPRPPPASEEVQEKEHVTSFLTLALFSAAMMFGALSSSADPDPFSAYRWKHRLLVLYRA